MKASPTRLRPRRPSDPQAFRRSMLSVLAAIDPGYVIPGAVVTPGLPAPWRAFSGALVASVRRRDRAPSEDSSESRSKGAPPTDSIGETVEGQPGSASGRSLLDFYGCWQGDDIEELLEMVYRSRIESRF
ncbi:MAG TPA: hypothetical protein VFJ58_28425 [Armatimonadota bacterium]|nr:hypothetical protein [Armatimonadota bacterium]